MSTSEQPVPRLERPEQVTTVLGLVTAGRFTLFDWLAADAAHAPDPGARIELSRFAAAELAGHPELERAAADHGAVLADVTAPYLELFDAIGRRTVSTDWWERMVRTTVAGGMVRDLVGLVVEHLADPGVAADALAGRDLTDLVAEEVGRATDADPRLAARLALWGRRVAGEALGAVQPVLGVVASTSGTDLGALAAPALGAISAGHARRMARLGLAA